MSSVYGEKSYQELKEQMARSTKAAADAVPCVAVTEQNWKGLLALEQQHSELLLRLIRQAETLMTADEMNNLIEWQTEQLRDLMTETAEQTEQYRAKLTAEAEAFTRSAQTAVSDLSKQAGSVSAQFGSALQEERKRMRRYTTRLFWISLIPTAVSLLSVLAWALWFQ